MEKKKGENKKKEAKTVKKKKEAGDRKRKEGNWTFTASPEPLL